MPSCKQPVTHASPGYALISLSEPEKQEVLAWNRGKRPLAASWSSHAVNGRFLKEWLILRTGRSSAGRRSQKWKPAFWYRNGSMHKKSSPSTDTGKEAMRKRGYDLLHLGVFSRPLPAGYFGIRSEEGRRLLKVTCFDTQLAPVTFGVGPSRVSSRSSISTRTGSFGSSTGLVMPTHKQVHHKTHDEASAAPK